MAENTPCIVCEEMCPVPHKAIDLTTVEVDNGNGSKITLQPPGVLKARCIGCGLCEYKCPVSGQAAIRVWPGPQWAAFDTETRAGFFSQTWQVSSRSDRTGYRLEGVPLKAPTDSLVSEPVRIGSVQVPPGGQPVVTLYDGPTVGGYAKIALVMAADLDRLVQTRPGKRLQFQLVA